MLKRMVVVAACVCLISISPMPVKAYTLGPVGGFLLKQVVKRVSKSAAIKYLDEGAEKKCLLWNRFVCAKVAR